jgi:hypothetical protein
VLKERIRREPVLERKEGPIDKKTQRNEKCTNHKGKEVKKK